MSWKRRAGAGAAGIVLAVAAAASASIPAALAAPASPQSGRGPVQPSYLLHRFGSLRSGAAKYTNTVPTGLPPSAIASVYGLTGLTPSSGAGAGELIAIIDARNDPNAARDLNAFSAKYGIPALPT